MGIDVQECYFWAIRSALNGGERLFAAKCDSGEVGSRRRRNVLDYDLVNELSNARHPTGALQSQLTFVISGHQAAEGHCVAAGFDPQVTKSGTGLIGQKQIHAT